MYYSFDRKIGSAAVLVGDDELSHKVPLAKLPRGAKPGDMFCLENGGYRLDEEESEKRRERIAQLQQKLKKG